MRAEALLLGVAILATVATVGAILVVPGFVAEPTVDDAPARLDVAESTIEAGEVTGETATFEVTTYVQHRGGTAENVTLVVRATDEASGLLVDAAEESIGTVTDEAEHEIAVPVTVPREGDYTIAAILYVDGERTDVARASVRGVGALTPPHAESAIEFHEFHARPPIEYAIVGTDNETVTLSVWSYLTNTGDEPESDLRLEITARQAESNVIADRTATTVGAIEAGRTTPTDVELTVPDGYNYYLDATLWRDDVVIDSTAVAANLDPQETISVNETRRPVRFEAGDFEVERTQDAPAERIDELEEEQPGFGPLVAIAALATGLFAARRWST